MNESDILQQSALAQGAMIRDGLLSSEELTAIYDSAPPLTGRIFKAARTAEDGAEEIALADGEIDRFLPKSLHGSDRATVASS